MRLAEIYGYGHFPHLDTRVGRQMFEDLEARWPKSSMVLHKFGLYYALTEKNYIKAFQYYSRSLEADQDNFPCLMDYLKMCQRLEIGWAPMLAMVDKTLTVVRRTPIMVKLMAMKGLLHWLINQDGVGKQQACNVWIAAVEKTPTAVSTIGVSSKHGVWKDNGGGFVIRDFFFLFRHLLQTDVRTPSVSLGLMSTMLCAS